VNFSPRGTGSSSESVRRFIEEADRRIDRADLIVFPEAMTLRGTGKRYLDVAEPLAGPGVQALAAFARRKHSWVVAGILEREGSTAYNTAVLLDREGALIGRYRKVYLPREEVEGGLTPGEEYPVFQTDFGKLGLMICWDIQYPDAARALALAGAEVLAVPIAGGNLTLGHARAIENHLFVVSSGYDYPTEIVDPEGNVIASANQNPGVAVAEIDLARRYTDRWLGHMRDRFFHEVRLDVPVTR
jgi:predicted amidohydrolase